MNETKFDQCHNIYTNNILVMICHASVIFIPFDWQFALFGINASLRASACLELMVLVVV